MTATVETRPAGVVAAPVRAPEPFGVIRVIRETTNAQDAVRAVRAEYGIRSRDTAIRVIRDAVNSPALRSHPVAREYRRLFRIADGINGIPVTGDDPDGCVDAWADDYCQRADSGRR